MYDIDASWVGNVEIKEKENHETVFEKFTLLHILLFLSTLYPWQSSKCYNYRETSSVILLLCKFHLERQYFEITSTTSWFLRNFPLFPHNFPTCFPDFKRWIAATPELVLHYIEGNVSLFERQNQFFILCFSLISIFGSVLYELVKEIFFWRRFHR